MRRIGVLVPAAADDPVWQTRLGAFLQALAVLGWTIGRNARIDTRWGTPNAAEIRKQAGELAALAPDVILGGGSSTITPLLQATRTVPIVFTLANDPVGSGWVDSLARPGGNATGFMSYEFSIAGKWLELLKEIAPAVTRVAVLRDASQAFATSMFATMQAVAPPLGVEVIPVNMRNAAEIEQSLETFARVANGGLIPESSAAAVRHRDLIIGLAARHKLPAVYWDRFFVVAGGLMSYGPDLVEHSTSGPLCRSHPQGRKGSRAQQGERLRRIGVLAGDAAAGEVDTQARNAALEQSLEQLGWTVGRNLQIDYRYGLADAANVRKYAAELVALAPDVILVSGASALAPLLQATRKVPIVFVSVADPVGAGFVESMARPGGNATGYIQFEYSLSGKWLELLKEIAPGVTRAAVLRDSAITSGVGQFAVIQSVASAAGVDVSPVNLRDAGEIERAVAAFARVPNGGLVVTASALTLVHSQLIITLAARHKLPAVYPRRLYVANGGLISYGFDALEQVRSAAGYVDRILKGEKPADLPVQASTKYELVISLKTAKALGLEVPPTVLSLADEVIE